MTNDYVIFIPSAMGIDETHSGFNSSAVALPARKGLSFGAPLEKGNTGAKNDWMHRAKWLGECLGLGSTDGQPLLIGKLPNAAGGKTAIVSYIVPPMDSKPKCCESAAHLRAALDADEAHGELTHYVWVPPSLLKGSAIGMAVECVYARLRYLHSPSVPLPVDLQLGVVPLAQVAGQDRFVAPAPDGTVARRLELCRALERELPAALVSMPRGDSGYAAYAQRCAMRVEPMPLGDIPTDLIEGAESYPLDELMARPYQHGTYLPHTTPLVRKRPPPPPWPMPTCDEELYEETFLEAYDKLMKEHLEWHNGVRARRPQPLFGGVEVLKPMYRDWFASGGALKCDGVGKFSPLCEAAPYPTHWNREWLLNHLSSSPDKQLAGEDGLWLGGIDLLDDAPFLMGLSGNLISAYGLEKMGNTASAASQAASDSIAREVHAFAHGAPQLYELPRAAGETCVGGPNARWTTCPWCNDPCGGAEKSDGSTRVVTSMSNPPDGGTTIGGDEVISKNVRCQLHAPEGKDPRTWKHPKLEQPSVGDRATNDIILASLADKLGVPIGKIAIDGWKMFHQWFYETSQLAKTGALVPLLERLEPHKRRLGVTHALVMAMGAGPASNDCQRMMNDLTRAFYLAFDELEAPHRADEPALATEFLAARAGLHDDFGCMARLAVCLVFTDDGEITVLGPAARIERANYAIYRSFGDGGAGMILADELKWVLSSHSLWCGLHAAPSLGVMWFSRKKRIKCISGVTAALAGKMTEEQYRSLISFISYLNSVLHEHGYLITPLWAPINSPRSNGDAALVELKSEERGKLKIWRKRMSTCPGTTLMRHYRSKTPPPNVSPVEWLSATDARLDWVDGVWTCGIGGAFYGLLWNITLDDSWRTIATIPLAEFLGMVGGLYITHREVPEAARIVAEVDAAATPHALIDQSDAVRLRVAHEVFMESELWLAIREILFTRHIWGDINGAPDATSRGDALRAAALTRALGLTPTWTNIPDGYIHYLNEVKRRLIELDLPAPSTAFERRKRHKRTGDLAEPGACAIKYMGLPAPKMPTPPRHATAPRSNVASPDDHPAPKRAAAGVALRASPLQRLGRLMRRSPSAATVVHMTPSPEVESPPRAGARRSLALPPPPKPAHVTSTRDELPPHRLPPPPAPRAPPPSAPVSAPPSEARPPNELPTAALRLRLEHLCSVATNKGVGFDGHRPDRLRSVLANFLNATAKAANISSVGGENSALRLYWEPYCAWLGIDPVRSNMDAHSGRDVDLYALECAIMGGFVPWTMARMPPKKGSNRKAALPTSGLKVAGAVRRLHLKRYHFPFFVPLTVAAQACDGLCKQYIIDHGPDALYPQRKEPLTNEIVHALLSLFSTGTKIGTRTVDTENVGWASLEAMFHTLAQTGFRKAEVSLAAGVEWNYSHVAMGDLMWLIDGVVYEYLTPELLERLQAVGGYALLRPPPSKADPLGLHWGACTIYLRYDARTTICAARALARMELLRNVPRGERKSTPLFVNFQRSVWRHTQLTDIFRLMLLLAGVPAEQVRNYSMHSWRIYLACALLAAGASKGTIQSLLRWRSEEALNIYARMNDAVYADHLAAAGQAKVSSIRTTTIAGIMQKIGTVDGHQHAAFQEAWLRSATGQTFDANTAATLPRHDEDDVMADLNSHSKQLYRLAKECDDEDA